MSSYSELIKNFERIRAYMRDFYVYGFKSRDDFGNKSARSYDDERRRIESWLGDHMSFVRSAEGKNVFISIDSRSIRHNPFYKAWKAKSFTDGDVTLHFILFDILHEPAVKRTIAELMDEIDEKYLSEFDPPMMFDESTVRKKLKEYCSMGIVETEKVGKKVYYYRAESTDLSGLTDALHYFSEVAPCGVIGSFILDKSEEDTELFTFKHHYMTSAIDSGVLASIFMAMREKRIITANNMSHRKAQITCHRMIPLRVFISVQSGRQHLLVYLPEFNDFQCYRIDYLSDVQLCEETPRFDELRERVDGMQSKMWGVSLGRNHRDDDALEHVDFTVTVGEDEDFIIRRLEREKRVGTVEKLNEHTYRFSADVFDAEELVPWIRTFICRITELNFSNPRLKSKFKHDLKKMYQMYGLGEEESE